MNRLRVHIEVRFHLIHHLQQSLLSEVFDMTAGGNRTVRLVVMVGSKTVPPGVDESLTAAPPSSGKTSITGQSKSAKGFQPISFAIGMRHQTHGPCHIGIIVRRQCDTVVVGITFETSDSSSRSP